MQMLFLWKRNSRTHRCCSFGKGTAGHSNAIPLKKEHQNQKYDVPLEKEQQTHGNVVPFEKGTAKSKI